MSPNLPRLGLKNPLDAHKTHQMLHQKLHCTIFSICFTYFAHKAPLHNQNLAVSIAKWYQIVGSKISSLQLPCPSSKSYLHGRACAGVPDDLFRASHMSLSPGADRGVVIYENAGKFVHTGVFVIRNFHLDEITERGMNNARAYIPLIHPTSKT